MGSVDASVLSVPSQCWLRRAIDLDSEAINRDANPRGTIPADDALLRMRRVIRRLYGEEQKAVS